MSYPTPDLASHPLVLGATDSVVVMATDSAVAYLSEGVTDVLVRASRIGLRPVLCTNPDAEMTFAARYMVEMLDGRWLLALPDGTAGSPLTGARWAFMTDPVRADRRDAVLGIDELERPPTLLAGFSVSTHHAAGENLVVGELAHVLADSLVGEQIAGWNVHEPALLRWDLDAFTQHARARMPDSARVFVVSSGGRFQATILVRRTSTGVEETVSGIAAVPGAHGYDGALAVLTERARTTLTTVAKNMRMPLYGSMSASPGWPDLMQRRGRAGPPTPLAMLVGPRAGKLLGLELSSIPGQHRIESVGRSHLPSTLATFAPRSEGSWQELEQLLRIVGLDRIRAAAGVTEPVADTGAEGGTPPGDTPPRGAAWGDAGEAGP